MSISIGHDEATLEVIRMRLREAPLAAVRQMLPDGVIFEACREHGYEWRQRKYGPVVTVLHFLAQAIQREESFAATWQELWTPLAAEFPGVAEAGIEQSGLTHARGRFPKEVMQTLAEWSCRDAEPAPSVWKGFRLMAIDGTMASMPREDDLVGRFGVHGTKHGESRYPLARLVTLLDLGQCTVAGWEFGPHHKGEPTYARSLVERLREGDLVLLDMGLTGSPTLSRILARGAQFLGRKNSRLKVEDVKILRYLGREDWIVQLPVNTPARKADPSLPETILARLFRATWKSPTGETVTEWFVTSLMDAELYTRRKLAILYHERWRIETSYLEFKQLFHADVLRSKKVDNVYKEMAAHILAYQLVRRLMAAAAARHGKKPAELSFLNAARWAMSYSAEIRSARAWKLPAIYENLLRSIASSEVDIRPGRVEPRAVARERKHYPRLRTSRAEWRAGRLDKERQGHPHVAY